MRKILEECPSCSGELIVTQLSCSRCTTVVSGHFQATPFARLSADQLRFLEIFVKTKGNIKEMERETGTSYWSIRSQLNDLIVVMGLATEPVNEGAEARQAILQQVERGEIGVEEAARLLGDS